MQNRFQTGACYAAIAASLFAMGAATSAAAQAGSASDQAASSAAADDMGDAEIVVTAQGREQRLDRVPVAVSVVTGQSLERANVVNLEQLSTRVAGVRLTQAPASDLLNIRGFGSGLNPGFEVSVGSYVDGLYRARGRSMRAALFDVERVEVLKGPQSIFFGANSIAGAFSIATKKPDGDFRYNASALYAPTDSEFNLNAGVSFPLTDTLSARVSGQFSGMNGYVYNGNLKRDEPHLRDWIQRTSLAWSPSDVLKTDFRLDLGQNRDRGSYPIELLNCPPDAAIYGAPRGACLNYLNSAGGTVDDDLDLRTATGDSFFNLDFQEAALTNDIGLGQNRLIAKTGFYHHKVDIFNNVIPSPLASPFGPSSLFQSPTAEKYHQFSQELRLVSPAENRFSYIIGGYFAADDVDHDFLSGQYFQNLSANSAGTVPSGRPIVRATTTRQKTRTLSAFVSFDYKLTDDLKLNAGLRYSNIRKKAHRTVVVGVDGDYPSLATLVPVPAAGQAAILTALRDTAADFAKTTRTDDHLMPSASLQYTVAPGTMIYASFSTGFKAGGYSFLNNNTFEPETVNSYEVGIKANPAPGLRLNLIGFLSDYKDLQESFQLISLTGVVAVIGNSAASRSKGIELSGSYDLAEGIRLSGDVSYLDARYKSYANGPCRLPQSLTTGCTLDLSGERRAYSPKFSGSVGLNLSYDVGDYRLTVDPFLSFSSSYFQQANSDPLSRQPGYAKYDLRVGFGPADGPWELAFIGRNLNDKITASFRNNVPTSPGSISAFPERGRSLALQISIRN